MPRLLPAPRRSCLFALLLVCLAAAGCSRFRHERHDSVWVSTRPTYLHDRVAAVSNRVGQVQNGQKLEVLEHGRRFYKVRTEKNEIGWIEEHFVIDSGTHAAFDKLADQHHGDSVVATAVVRDEIYMHLTPGRSTDKFYLLPENAKVQLLTRASVVKTSATGSRPVAPPAANGQPEAPPAPILEDWWLVRDQQNRVGWLLGSRLDVDVPDEIGLYAEGQRIVGAYVIAKVIDPESSLPNHEVPEYLTVMAPPHSGLPFDFDQVRLFTWSLKRHRYETAFRLHPIQGFLPLKVGNEPIPGGSQPAFQFQIAADDSIITDLNAGTHQPAHPRTLHYALVDTQVKRLGPDLAPLPSTHKDGDNKSADNSKKKSRKKGH